MKSSGSIYPSLCYMAFAVEMWSMRDMHPWACPKTIKVCTLHQYFQCFLLGPGSSKQEGLAKEPGQRVWHLGVPDS